MSGVVIDTSAAVAILTGEPIGGGAIAALADTPTRLLSAATLVELGIVLEARFGPIGAAVADRFLREAEVDVVDVDRRQADEAIAAWRRFGKGRHPARLNLGGCFAYALAAVRSLPVLCTGDDFGRTDIDVVALGPIS